MSGEECGGGGGGGHTSACPLVRERRCHVAAQLSSRVGNIKLQQCSIGRRRASIQAEVDPPPGRCTL